MYIVHAAAASASALQLQRGMKETLNQACCVDMPESMDDAHLTPHLAEIAASGCRAHTHTAPTAHT